MTETIVLPLFLFSHLWTQPLEGCRTTPMALPPGWSQLTHPALVPTQSHFLTQAKMDSSAWSYCSTDPFTREHDKQILALNKQLLSYSERPKGKNTPGFYLNQSGQTSLWRRFTRYTRLSSHPPCEKLIRNRFQMNFWKAVDSTERSPFPCWFSSCQKNLMLWLLHHKTVYWSRCHITF